MPTTAAVWSAARSPGPTHDLRRFNLDRLIG
jgi:hypothetical protein